MFCSKCGKQNRSDAKFCNGCGDAMASTVSVNSEVSLQAQPKQFTLKKIHIIAACAATAAVATALIIVFAIFNRGNLERNILGDWLRVGIYNADGDFRESPDILFALRENGTYLRGFPGSFSSGAGSWRIEDGNMQLIRRTETHQTQPKIRRNRLYLYYPESGETHVYTRISTHIRLTQVDAFVGEWVSEWVSQSNIYLFADGTADLGRPGNSSWELANDYIVIRNPNFLARGYIVADTYLVFVTESDDGQRFASDTLQRR